MIKTMQLAVSKCHSQSLFSFVFSAFLILAAYFPSVLGAVPEPKEIIGFTPGEDYRLASWSQVVDYFKALDAASDRVLFREIGKTTLGAPFVYAIISSPQNLNRLDYYRQINAKLADPRSIKSPAEAEKLVKAGRSIVLITCGIHSTEVGSYLSSMLIAYELASSEDQEIKSILENSIILLVPSLNPDGVDIVKNWYDRTYGTQWEGTDPPELYHKYVGHDNNRDWYAFTQAETRLTVDFIHNVWHPQVVHDIHQQGTSGARLFLPPYMEPVEPNVPKQIVEGYSELGSYIANEMRKAKYYGITTNTTYDAWTPARAYSHYHGGVRILSETASARLASPITIQFKDLRGGVGGLDTKKESVKFGPVWQGGTWRLSDITNYMTTAARYLMMHLAENREKWLRRFLEIGQNETRNRGDGELQALFLPMPPNEPGSFLSGRERLQNLVSILKRGGVELRYVTDFNRTKGREGYLIDMRQPYASFARAMLLPIKYPDLRDETGHPIPPYDVTAHTLSLLMGLQVEEIKNKPSYKAKAEPKTSLASQKCPIQERTAIYRSEIPSMDEGWTRWLFSQAGPLAACGSMITSIRNNVIRDGRFSPLDTQKLKTIIFPDQSSGQIFNGYGAGLMPPELTGGIGKEGAAQLRKFVEQGGRLVFLNRSSDFAIERLNLPVTDVTDGLPRPDFYIPGSILSIEIGLPGFDKNKQIAWFENGPAFEFTGSQTENTFRVIARYPKDQDKILLSGWALGLDKLAGRAAIMELSVGRGKIILFGFRPQYRGQSLATLPIFIDAINGFGN
ncbi:MAG TPA: M14 family metallopeptidase [Pyrinomonadaceae bacterium]|nr:M14 family metallopeptidase [Pyrinomonadaceae bacterium]